jgi:hypothetical protein
MSQDLLREHGYWIRWDLSERSCARSLPHGAEPSTVGPHFFKRYCDVPNRGGFGKKAVDAIVDPFAVAAHVGTHDGARAQHRLNHRHRNTLEAAGLDEHVVLSPDSLYVRNLTVK